MTRRLHWAGIGICAFLLPACASDDKLTDPYYRGGPGYVLMNPANNPASRRLVNDPGYARAGDPRRVPPDPVIKPAPPVDEVKPPVEMVKHEEPTADVLPPVVEPPAAGGPRVIAQMDEEIKKPDWPLIGGKPIVDPPVVKPPEGQPKVEPSVVKPPEMLPKIEPPVVPGPAVPADPMIGIKPPDDVGPPLSGTSLKVPEPAAPTVGAAPQPMSADETLLVRAIRAFQANRPQDAAEALKHLDPANQEVLMYLTPLLVRLTETSTNSMPPDELAMQIDRLQNAATMMKGKAALRADRVCFCKGVRKFADVDPYDARHEFRPGDMVFLYAELKNFTCEPIMTPPRQPMQRGFTIRLATTLELRDARNNLVWRSDLTKTDFAQTPPQDYYHTYRFCVPEKLPPGVYTLWLNITDKPTNRVVRKPVEMRVAQQ
jgi:hypothetical protein